MNGFVPECIVAFVFVVVCMESDWTDLLLLLLLLLLMMMMMRAILVTESLAYITICI